MGRGRGGRPWSHQDLGWLDLLYEALSLAEDYTAMFLLTDNHDPTLLYCAFFFFPILDSITKLIAEMSPCGGDDLLINMLSEVAQCLIFMHFADFEAAAVALFCVFGGVQTLIIVIQFCQDDESNCLECGGGCSCENISPMSCLGCLWGNLTGMITELNIFILVLFFSEDYAPWFSLWFEIPFVLHCWGQGQAFAESLDQMTGGGLFSSNSTLQLLVKGYEKCYNLYLSILTLLYIGPAKELLCVVSTPDGHLAVNRWIEKGQQQQPLVLNGSAPPAALADCSCSGAEPLIVGLLSLLFCLGGCSGAVVLHAKDNLNKSPPSVLACCLIFLGLILGPFWMACLAQDETQEYPLSITLMILAILTCCIGCCCGCASKMKGSLMDDGKGDKVASAFLLVLGVVLVVIAARQIKSVHGNDEPFFSDCDVELTYPHAPSPQTSSGSQNSSVAQNISAAQNITLYNLQNITSVSVADVEPLELEAYISPEDAEKYQGLAGYKFEACGKDSFDYQYLPSRITRTPCITVCLELTAIRI
jgi:hypothetical protein